MKWFWLTSCFFIFSCSNRTSKEAPLNKSHSYDSLRTKLLGYWGALESDIPVWKITDDSIHYFGENRAYHYKIIDGNIEIGRADSKATFSSISIIGDTMIFYPHGPNSQTRIFRIKKNN